MISILKGFEMSDDRRFSDHWHLDKRLNIGHILTTLSALGAIVIWGTTIEARLSVLETQAIYSHQIQKDIKNELVRINDKLDRFIEHNGNRR